MSTNLPPTGPPSGPPAGPPWGTPSGPPPSGPPAGAAEVLEQGSGGPLPPVPPTQSAGGGGRRTGLIIGGVIGALALGGGAFAAYSWFTGTGPQPAEALPADTLGYVSVDFDPSNEQKLKLYNTLKKFPALEKWFDEQGLDAGDDLKQKIFDAMQKDGVCGELDYADDIEPWLGDRFAVAAIDQGDDKNPAPVGVLQVKDADAADEGMDKLSKCESDGSGEGGWVIEGDWLVVAETEELAQQVVDDTANGSLADDEGFQTWTDAAGDPGFLTAYASKEAGAFIADAMMQDFAGLGGITPDAGATEGDAPDAELDAMGDMMKGFEGGALTIRADDGSLELEIAADTKAMGLGKLTASDRGGEAIESLPGNTAFAYGVGFEEGWAQALLDYMVEVSGGQLDLEQMISQAEQSMGLALPEDLETLMGDSAALAVSNDVDIEALLNSEGVPDIPVGIKIKGDPAAVQEVLDKIKATAPSEEDASFLSSETDGDMIAIGPDTGYLADLVKEGDLGDSDAYRDVVADEDASAVMFLDADSLDALVEELGSGDETIIENYEPVRALGMTSWEVDGVGHGLVKLTTD